MTSQMVYRSKPSKPCCSSSAGATLSSSLAMPTTAKTLIRRVLELPLPKEGSVRIVGIDEWAWKKGSRYGTILVDIEQRRVAALLPERSVETSTAWFKKHPEIRIVSRDRGKIFRAAADAGAPQAKKIVDRFHLQKNVAEALEKFFSHHKQVLEKAAQHLAGKTLPPPETVMLRHIEQERKRRSTERIRRHKQIWKLFRAGYRKEEIAQIVGVGSRSVYRALEQEQPPTQHSKHWAHHLVDPYVPYLAKRWNEGCHTAKGFYGMVEGFVNKVKWIKRSSYGQAGFPLLQRRVLLHPTTREIHHLRKCSLLVQV